MLKDYSKMSDYIMLKLHSKVSISISLIMLIKHYSKVSAYITLKLHEKVSVYIKPKPEQ